MTDKIAPAMPITPCGAVSRCYSDPSSYTSGRPFETMAATARKATEALQEARARDVATHEQNLPAIAHNEAARAAITAIMKAAGIPDEFIEPNPKSRSFPPKRRRVPAGYIADLRRTFPTSDGFAEATRTYETLKARYDAYAQKAEQEAATKAAEREREAARRRADVEFAMLLVRYGLDAETEPWRLLEVIRSKNQYLDLAIAMRNVRSDWSEGCEQVADALGRFRIETDQDRAIAADIHSAISCFHEDNDGRVFRDTAWNYDRLFGLVPEELQRDAEKAREIDNGR